MICDFNVHFDQWFRKNQSRCHCACFGIIRAAGFLYQKTVICGLNPPNLAMKDRVVRRANGQFTYFASDIAYHKDKLDRGYDKIIDVWGSDHHGYIKRVKAALTAMGYDASVWM